ncbi:unnamed protein product [Rotaria magnacalcarata]|uniref:Uncharacterized protein n=1 Tax=Rotaria magnacalcarata TaxID=392030 RepID=A0A816SV65_9BILA|nr:unnamed protein product [Rotaria magnacalcarata]
MKMKKLIQTVHYLPTYSLSTVTLDDIIQNRLTSTRVVEYSHRIRPCTVQIRWLYGRICRLRAVVFDLGNELPPNYLLLHDFIPPNLISLARSLRSIEKFDNLMVKGHSKIFNHEERVCCNCDGTNGKFPSPPRHKRILLYIFIKLILNERSTTRINDERHELYFKCEKQFSTEKALTKYRGINLAQFIKNNRSNDEKQFFCSLFRLTIPKTYYIS